MNKDNTGNSQSSSKLMLLRQKKRELNKQNVDIEKAIEGFAASIDDRTMIAEIERNSAIVNWIIDKSGTMEGTSGAIAQEINEFALRQAGKIYTTQLSLTVFDDEVYTKFSKLNARQFAPIPHWNCWGGTNIFDALFSAIIPITPQDANHKLHLLITDGQNGDSQHTQEQVHKLITSRENCGEHVFLLYNTEYGGDAQDYAPGLGIKPSNAVNFNRNGDGIKIIFQAMEDLLDGLRTKGSVPEDWARAITAHAANPMAVKAREIKYLG